MAILICFLCGIANFAMHKAVSESGHPVLKQLPSFLLDKGGRGGFVLEFAILLGSMLFAGAGSDWAAGTYLGYTALNALSAWLILSGRM